MFHKVKRVRSEANLKKCRLKPCLVCCSLDMFQQGPTQPDHITTRGAGGGDEESNIMPLCFYHHRQRHDIGLPAFVSRYRSVQIHLRIHGREDVLAKASAIT